MEVIDEKYDPNVERKLMMKQQQLDKQRLALRKMDDKLDDMEAQDQRDKDREEEDEDEYQSPTDRIMQGPVKLKTNSISDRLMKGKQKKEVVK